MQNKNVLHLRKNMTEAEKKIWYYVKNRQFFNLKFRRQVPIGNYIVDFVCYDKKLIIEIDGSQHLTNDGLIYDEERTKFLNNNGYKVIRFYNNDVLTKIEQVLEQLRIEIEE